MAHHYEKDIDDPDDAYDEPAGRPASADEWDLIQRKSAAHNSLTTLHGYEVLSDKEADRIQNMISSPDKENLTVAEELIKEKRLITDKTMHFVDEGMPVTYMPYPDGEPYQKGIIKSLADDNDYVFVVYNCGGEWERYKEYTGARTSIKDLILGW